MDRFMSIIKGLVVFILIGVPMIAAFLLIPYSYMECRKYIKLNPEREKVNVESKEKK